jgi:hypothetical protein
MELRLGDLLIFLDQKKLMSNPFFKTTINRKITILSDFRRVLVPFTQHFGRKRRKTRKKGSRKDVEKNEPSKQIEQIN